jgi:hypothetical protein
MEFASDGRLFFFERDDEQIDTIGRITRYTADTASDFTAVIPGSRFVLLGESIMLFIGDVGGAVAEEIHVASPLSVSFDGESH